MKKLLKILLITMFVFCLGAFSITAYAEEVGDSSSYSLSFDDEYLLYKDGEVVKRTSDIEEIISAVEVGASLYFDDITLNESLTVNKDELILSGSLMLTDDASIIIDGGKILLRDFSLTSDKGGVRVRRGSLSLYSGSIRSGGVAITLDFSLSGIFNMYGGSVYSEGEYAVLISRGGAFVSGGYIECKDGYAINNSSSLTLFKNPSIRGREYDILTSSEISLTSESFSYEGSMRVKFSAEFPEGEATPMFYVDDEGDFGGVTVFDKNGEQMTLKLYQRGELSFEDTVATVYRPYIISLKYRDNVISTVEYVKGMRVTLSDPPSRLGYSFVGWYTASDEVYDTATVLTSNINLYAKYKLVSPTFNLFYENFTYDGEDRYIRVENISHPLLDSGYLSYEWYKDGDKLSSYSERHRVRNVSDGGEYSVLISLTVGQDSVTVSTPTFNLVVNKAQVIAPVISEKVYTGSPIAPEIRDNEIYTAEDVRAILAGVYPIKLTLVDKENYEFSGSDKDYIYVDFRINRAENSWITSPTVRDIYTNQTPSPTAKATFGEVKYQYSKSDKLNFSENVPAEAGEYLMRAVVIGTDNYEGLESFPIPFEIISEVAVGISIKNQPNKTEYVAFEQLLTTGIIVEVAYNSGRVELVGADVLSFEYQMADSFRYGDVGVRVSYLDCSVMLPVTISRASYDINDIVFSDQSFVYDGTKKTLVAPTNLPTGLDGIPLTATVVGGGIDAGEYVVYLNFSTESESYNIPESLSARLRIAPRECDVVWENDSFVYDGSVKIPTAFFLDIHNRRVNLTVEGGRTLAGAYTAEATYNGENYVLKNPTTAYEIKKADYDMSGAFWVGGNYTYDGEDKIVALEGLPVGVEVIGYINNKAKDAGEYTALVLLSYDEDNYNPPIVSEYTWWIAKGEYDIGGFAFSDNTVVFDGMPHYPLFSGEMPTGLDGIQLEYSFLTGVSHVSEGKVRVEINFSTTSRNYLTPSPTFAYVSITPREIYVSWEGVTLVYNGRPQAPTAISKETSVSVSHYAINAGEYKTYATADNSDYKIINNEIEFVIEKAENVFTKGPTFTDIFYGREPNIKAECLSGEINITYYSDEGRKEEIVGIPRAVGRYYFVVSSPGDNNYHAIMSDVLSFEIIAVVPIMLDGKINKEYFSAYERVGDGDITLLLSYNDGTKKTVSLSDATLEYERGESFLFGDTHFLLSYNEFSLRINVDVRRAKYNLTNISWKNTLQIYDGTEKSVYLEGLPEGIKITGYVGNGRIGAGEYTVDAVFEYDEENYIRPEIPRATLVIAKRVVDTPVIEPVIYNGSTQMPSIQQNPLYTAEFNDTPVNAGSYPIKYTLIDKDNYSFSGGKDEIIVGYVIEKRVLNIIVGDVTLYLFENKYTPNYTLTSGTLLSTDALIPTYSEADGFIYVSFEGLPNYDINVTPGRIERVNKLSASMSLLLFIVIIITIILILFAYLSLKKRSYSYINSRGAIMHLPPLEVEGGEVGVEVENNNSQAVGDDVNENTIEQEVEDNDEPAPPEEIRIDEPTSQASEEDEEPIPPEEIAIDEIEPRHVESSEDEPTPPEEIPICPDSVRDVEVTCDVGGISKEYADEVITNSTARDLLLRDDVIITEGNRRGIINVDTLSRSFLAGDRVDINILKEHKLIPYDTSYIKVLARGVIDKPLNVYANDFSLSAIKMIVLSGGRAVRANTYSITKKVKNT